MFRLVHLAVKINKISHPIAKSFLDSFSAFEKKDIVEIFNNFDHLSATAYMVTLAKLNELFKENIL